MYEAPRSVGKSNNWKHLRGRPPVRRPFTHFHRSLSPPVSGASLSTICTSKTIPGQLLKDVTDNEGKNKSAALLVGVELDLEVEVHLTARIKGDLCVGLY